MTIHEFSKNDNLTGILLVVDNQPAVCKVIRQIFEDRGTTVYTTEFGTEALRMVKEYPVDVVFADICMPDFSGLELLAEIKKYNSEICVIMLTGLYDVMSTKNAFRLGAYDLIMKPFSATDIQMSFLRGLEHRRLMIKQRKYQQELEETVAQKTIDLQNVVMQLDSALSLNRKAHLETTIVLSKIAEINDEDTGNHLKRVSYYCEHLSRAIGLPNEMVEQMTYSSTMHDIGKIFISSTILKKSDFLTPQEFETMKLHTVYGARILEDVPFLQTAHDIALYHHENYDGSGYPYGLHGSAIPYSARIVSLCDVFDALISARCYKQSYSLDTAITIIRSEIGRRFDPEIADIFLKIKDLMFQIYLEFKD